MKSNYKKKLNREVDKIKRKKRSEFVLSKIK